MTPRSAAAASAAPTYLAPGVLYTGAAAATAAAKARARGHAVPIMDNQDNLTKGPPKSPILKHRSQPKDTLSNGKAPTMVRSKFRMSSKVPRVVKSPSNQCNTNKSVEKITDNSGDNKAGTSKTIHFFSKKDAAEKSRPSCIPRRKTNSAKEATTRDNTLLAASKKKNLQHIGERNVQRVQMLINQDYLPEEHPLVRSVARPIPTLGSVYARATNVDHASLNDWFNEIIVPVNSIISNARNDSCRQDDAKESSSNDVDTNMEKRRRVKSCISPHKQYISPGITCHWLASDMEYPTRDNESAYHVSCLQTYTPVDLPKEKFTENSAAVHESPSTRIDNLIKRSPMARLSEHDCPVIEKSAATFAHTTPTLVLSPNSTKIESNASDTDSRAKKCQYPSNPGIPRASQATQNHPVPSYVECHSEILQKTTNFEGCDEARNSLTSITCTDLEIRDELSSECTLDDGSLCDRDFDLCFKCGKPEKRNSKKDESSETTSIADSTLCQYTDESLFEIDTCVVKDSAYNVILYDNSRHYYAKDCKNSNREKYKRFRRFPSARHQELGKLTSMRGHVSLRICRRRLSRVWKKTTERWALWSAKPPQRYRRPCIMRYVQRSPVKNDANVQTNTFSFKETATDSIPKQKKSEAVTVFPDFGISFESYKSEGGTDATASPYSKNKGRNYNLGPSLFPYLYNPERNAFIKETIRSYPIPELKIDKNKQLDKETQITEIPEETRQNEIPKEFDDPDSVIQICEVSVDDKGTDTEDMLSTVKEQMTSTLIHLPALRVVTIPWIVCSDSESKELEKKKSYKETSLKVTTTPNIKTLIMHDPQVTPVATQEVSNRGAPASNKSVKNTSNQTIDPVANNPVMFVPVTPLKAVAIATSRKEYIDAGLTACHSKLNTDICQAPPPLICKCPLIKPNDIKSIGTDTDEASIHKKSNASTKLKTYVNTGMLINSIVEKAILRGSPKFSVSADTKSIGNKYTSDIGICATTILKDSVIGTEKEILPKRLSASTNTFMKLESKFTEQNSSFATDDAKLSEIGTQYSDNVLVGGALCRSDGIGDSCLMTVRTLTHSAEEMEAQTEISLPERVFVEIPRNQLPLSVSTSYTAINPFIDQTPISTYKYITIKGLPKNEQIIEGVSEKKSKCNPNINTAHNHVASTVLASALDAVKWINAGYPVGNGTTDHGNVTTAILKDTKSVDNTTQCVKKGDEISHGSLLSPAPQATIVAVQAITPNSNAPTARASSDSKSSKNKYASKVACSIIDSIVQRGCPVDNSTSTVEHLNGAKNVSAQPEENQATVQMMDGATSDVFVKDVKEITLQANPDSCNAATECSREKTNKSASALTSRCILPGLPFYCCKNHRYGELSGDCRFVYGVPQCVVHTYNTAEGSKMPKLCHTQYVQVQAAEVTTKVASNETQIQDTDGNESNQLQFITRCHAETTARTSTESNTEGFCLTSDGKAKCSCVSTLPVDKQTNNTIDTIEDVPIITLNTKISPLNLNKKSEISNNLSLITNAESVACSQTKSPPSLSTQKSRNSTSTKTSFNENSSLRSIATMTVCCPTTEQQTSMQAFGPPRASNATSINRDQFERTVSLVTSFPTNITLHMQTSEVGDTMSNTTSINNDRVEHTVGLVTSDNDRVEHTVGLVTSDNDRVEHTVGLVTPDNDRVEHTVGLVTPDNDRVEHTVGLVTPDNDRVEHTVGLVTPDNDRVEHTVGLVTPDNDRVEHTVGLVTSVPEGPMMHKKTSHVNVSVSQSTSLDQNHLMRTIGFTTSSSSRPVTDHKPTSNIYRIASAKTSMQQQIARSIGLVTSRQNNPPIHSKACSNIIKCASAKTSMYDEFSTQSVGVINDGMNQDYVSGTSTRLEEHCVQSVGVINTCWKGKAAIKTIRSPHAFQTQSSEFGFLLSPKEYEALYKTTRYLSKEAAKATTAIKGEKLGHQQSYNQADAAVEVLLRADMKSAQNMASPAMHSATVMTAPSAATTSSVFDSGTPTPSCSVKCPLEIPTRDNDTASSGSVVCFSTPRTDSVKNHLAASCRYYSTLLTKQLDNVKENLTKHLTETPSDTPSDFPIYCDNCTMKPSACEEFACQTFNTHTKQKPPILDPSENETDICRHDKEHLQSVYYMLTAIEGRLRRLKSNVEYNP